MWRHEYSWYYHTFYININITYIVYWIAPKFQMLLAVQWNSECCNTSDCVFVKFIPAICFELPFQVPTAMKGN